jgi:predicted patatin/cPLA2 family phospholipase
MKEKTAIILIGGGMRSSHGAGFLYALATQFGITQPDIMIGSSGDAGNVAYFAAGQYESIKKIWCELLSTSDFISMWRLRKIMDIDYLVDTVFKKQEPLAIEQLRNSPIELFIPVTHARTGHCEYLTKDTQVDFFEILRATAAIPIFYGKQVSILGEKYVDGELTPTIVDHVKKALSAGATRILVITNKTPLTRFNTLETKIYTHFVSKGLREAVLREISTSVSCVTAPGATVLCVGPRISIRSLTNAKEKLRANFDRGVEDARAMKDELSALFSVHELSREQESPIKLRDPRGV